MKKLGKKTIILVALLVAVFAASAYGSYAYFTSGETATNTFVVGDIAITLTEPGWTGEHLADPAGRTTYVKDPTVTNTGSNDAYVRVKVTFSSTGVTYQGALIDSLGGLDSSAWTRSGSGDEYVFTYHEILEPGDSVTLFTSVTLPAYSVPDESRSAAGGFDIDLTAEAIQASGFSSAADAFAAFANS